VSDNERGVLGLLAILDRAVAVTDGTPGFAHWLTDPAVRADRLTELTARLDEAEADFGKGGAMRALRRLDDFDSREWLGYGDYAAKWFVDLAYQAAQDVEFLLETPTAAPKCVAKATRNLLAVDMVAVRAGVLEECSRLGAPS